MKYVVLATIKHILQPVVRNRAIFSLTIMKLTLDLFPSMSISSMSGSSKFVGFAYTGFPYLAEEIPPLFEQRDDFIFEPGQVIALPQGTDVPQGNTILVELRLSIISTIGQSLKPCHRANQSRPVH